MRLGISVGIFIVLILSFFSGIAGASISETTHTVPLKSGWDMISTPLNLSIWNLGEEAIAGDPLNVTPKNCLSSIYRYISSSGQFEKSDHFDNWGWYPATGSENFTKLEPGRGYWIMAKNDCSLTFTGTMPSDLHKTIAKGWNLIGWYSMNEALLGEEAVLGDPLDYTPKNSLTSIYRYNTTSGAFEKSDHFADWGWWPATGSENFTKLELGRGYWVMASNNSESNPGLPPDPSTVAPPIDATVATNMVTATEFLYTGSNPIQTGVTGTIEARRAAVLRGRVLTREGTNLSGVNITILSHPEFGNTMSRADGMFDMAVNGGGLLTVNYEKAGYLSAQRQVNAPWQDYAWLPEVVMIQVDPQVTTINLSSSESIQVARGSHVTDADGSRQATLFFPQGIQANMTLPDGTTQPLTSMHVRATEYTVGDGGPEAMPAVLPPTSGYTYAVELSVDEAGSMDVYFDRPVYTYVENFLDFPVGGIVPSGYYNRSLGQWIPSKNGKIIKILGITGGLADLDIDGSNQSANASQLIAINITGTERQQLATLYRPNQSLWRVPINHFSSWDFNWPFRPDCDPAVQSCAPNQPQPDWNNPQPENPDNQCGSIIGCQNQVLGEAVDIVGTPFSLHYQSNRVPGYKDGNTLNIPLSGGSAPASLKSIELEIDVAGDFIKKNFSASPNQEYTFEWDGKDTYGRKLQGMWPITVRIGYTYNGVYLQPSEIPGYGYDSLFGHFSYYGIPISGDSERLEATLWQEWKGSISSGDAQSLGTKGWSLDIHHVYDPVGKILYMGDGSRRSAKALGSIITTVGTGNYSYPCGAIAPDESLYYGANNRIHRVGPDGNISTIAGNGSQGFSGDGGPATQAQVNRVSRIEIGPDGSLYFIDGILNYRIRRIGPDGIINTVAGNGDWFYNGNSGDGGLATQTVIRPSYLAVGPDGSLYFSDSRDERIRRIGTDGIISTVVGNGSQGYSGDGGPATQAELNFPGGIAVGSDGSLYISDRNNYRIRQVGPDGIISTVAGNGSQGYSGDGGPAAQAAVTPYMIAIGNDGSLFIADAVDHRIRRVGPDGIINTVAGNGFHNPYLPCDGCLATQAPIYSQDIWIGPEGSLYTSIFDNGALQQGCRRIAIVFSAGFANIFIPSEDGSEVYIFNNDGRHLRTLDALTNAVHYQFGYDSAGYLINVTDGDGNVMTIERDAGGNATAFVSPYGERTNLTLDTNGYLASITNPAGESAQFAYTTEGLLTRMIESRGNVYNFSYDVLGRLRRDEDPAGGVKTLARTDIANGYSVTLSTGLNRNTTYQIEQLSTDDQRRVNTFPNGLKTETIIGKNGSKIDTYPDGTRTTLLQGPDPRFGMLAPVPKILSITTPQGLTGTITTERTAGLNDSNDPLSLKVLTETASINGRTFISTFDAVSRNITVLTPTGRTGTATLDNKGRVVESQIPGVIPVQYTYDIRGRIDTIRQGLRTYSLNYDDRGNLKNITDPLSRSVGFDYDLAGRVTRQTLTDGRQIGYTYDANGNVISITPPGRPAHIFNYTLVDLMKDYLPPDIGVTGQTSYTYNIDRQLTKVMRPDGASIDLGYDSAGRLSTINYPQGITSRSYNSSTGNLKDITAPDGGKITYGYDGSLLTDTTWSGIISGSVHRTYDNNFRVTSENVNGNAVNFQYDLDGLLTNAGELALSRDPQNGVLTGSALGTITDTHGYNSYGELASYQAASSGSGILAVNYTRDDLGRIIRKNETIDGAIHTYDYTYDLAGRLTNVSKDGVQVSRYVYDANGNRLSYTGPGGTISGTYDNQDRLLQYGTTTYTYTANGELQSKTVGGQTTTYQYDVMGNLRNVTLPDGMQIEYVIDGQNRRTGKKVNGVLVQGFLYKDQLSPIAEMDGGGNVVSRFVYAGGSNVPEYMVKGGVTYRIITDHLGSPRLVVNAATGGVAQRMDYDEFGNVTFNTNPSFQPFGFAGGIYDRDIKVIRFGARDYDAETGRWTTKDQILFAGKQSNLYGYLFNDPVNLIDAFGFEPNKPIYDTPTEAAQAALSEMLPISISTKWEYGTQILKKDGKFYYLPPITDKKYNKIKFRLKKNSVAVCHTHPTEDSMASSAEDKEWRIDNYIAGSSGRFFVQIPGRYDPLFLGGPGTIPTGRENVDAGSPVMPGWEFE